MAFTLETNTGEKSGKRPSRELGDGQKRKKVKFDDGYRSSQDRDGSGKVKEGEDEQETTKEEEEVEEELEEETELVEVFPPEGVEAKLDQLLNHRIGVLTVIHPDTGKPLLVLFNITEVWVGESPFLETHSSWTLKQVANHLRKVDVYQNNYHSVLGERRRKTFESERSGGGEHNVRDSSPGLNFQKV